jgi:hypothetical protein
MLLIKNEKINFRSYVIISYYNILQKNALQIL